MHSLLAGLILLASGEPPVREAIPQVTIPLPEYERLRKSAERAPLTVVEVLRVGGSFKGKGLTLDFVGRSSGSLPTEKVLLPGEGIGVFGCEGEGIVSRAEDGAFLLTPLAPKFSVRCRLVASGSDRLEISAPRSVLWVESTVADGELASTATAEGGVRVFSVVRMTGAAAEGLLPTATGRYRLTLLPDETRFRYQIEVHNSNRSRQRFDITMISGERVQQVDAQATYEVEKSRYRFDLPPGDSMLILTGTLSGSAFTAPVAASLQYALLESHPLLRPVASGVKRRVAPTEVGLTPAFRGAQAFLLGKDERLAWTVTRVEALRTTSFALNSARHLLFVPAEGPILGQSDFQIDNQGASDLTLPTRPEPTFASFGGEPVLLTKNAEGMLWLPLSHGEQAFVLQYRQPATRRLGLLKGMLLLPRLPVTATTLSVEVRYPREWVPLYECFAIEHRVHFPEAETVLGLALLLLWLLLGLRFLDLPTRKAAPLLVALGLASMALSGVTLLLILVNVGLSVFWLVVIAKRKQWESGKLVGSLVAVAFGITIVLAMSSLTMRKTSSSGSSYGSGGSYAEKKALPSPQPTRAPGVQPSDADYQGLPAKFDFPGGSEQSAFSGEMVSPESAPAVQILAVSRTLLFWLGVLPALAAAGIVLRLRNDLTGGLQARLQELRGG